jgi:ketosteroid isomerase-like protein
MTSNEQLIFDFYTAFQSKEAEKMVSIYSETIRFNDPAFGDLQGEDAKNMWRMLIENGTDLKIEFKITDSDQNWVTAHWEAYYTFSRTGRSVHNKIDATFTIENGEITNHVDTFNLWSWSKQAMGTTGWLLGWSEFFRKKLHKTTHKMLSKHSSKL